MVSSPRDLKSTKQVVLGRISVHVYYSYTPCTKSTMDVQDITIYSINYSQLMISPKTVWEPYKPTSYTEINKYHNQVS